MNWNHGVSIGSIRPGFLGVANLNVRIALVEGIPVICYLNSVVVASDGNIYCTEASTRFSPFEWDGTFEASIPDNLMRGSNGKIWLGFAKPRSKVDDMLDDKPFIRKMILRLSRFLWPVPKA